MSPPADHRPLIERRPRSPQARGRTAPPWETAGPPPVPGAPAVTVSLVTYDGTRWLPGCLASIRAQTVQDVELIVIDNASRDGSAEWLVEALRDWPGARLHCLPDNRGFAGGHDLGIREARAPVVLLLNQDVELEPDFLERALPAFDDPRVAAVQGKLLRLSDRGLPHPRVDTTGLVASRSRRFTSRGQGLPDDARWATPGEVFGADGPAPLYRRRALADVATPSTDGPPEYLDQSFFMYKEDVDLAWRLRLFGWRARYVPDAVGWHARETVSGSAARTDREIVREGRSVPLWIKRISWRNQRLMQVKNEVPGLFLADLPWVGWRELRSMAYLLLFEPRRLAAVPDTLRLLPGALRRRRWIMGHRRASAAAMRAWFRADG